MRSAIEAARRKLWLVEPDSFALIVQQVLRVPTCPSAREVVARRRELLAAAKNAAREVVSGGGRGPRGYVGVIGVHGRSSSGRRPRARRPGRRPPRSSRPNCGHCSTSRRLRAS